MPVEARAQDSLLCRFVPVEGTEPQTWPALVLRLASSQRPTEKPPPTVPTRGNRCPPPPPVQFQPTGRMGGQLTPALPRRQALGTTHGPHPDWALPTRHGPAQGLTSGGPCSSPWDRELSQPSQDCRPAQSRCPAGSCCCTWTPRDCFRLLSPPPEGCTQPCMVLSLQGVPPPASRKL